MPVFYNGEALPRPHALDNLKNTVNLDIGVAKLHSFDLPMKEWIPGDKVVCYLQGLPIDQNHKYSSDGRPDIIHLDEEQFTGRLPDRDSLIEGDQAWETIRNATRAFWKKTAKSVAKTLSDYDLCQMWDFFNSVDLSSLYMKKNIEYIPAQWVTQFNEAPMVDRPYAYQEYLTHPDKPVKVSELQARGLFDIDPMTDIAWNDLHNQTAWQYTFLRNAFILDSTPDSAWLFELAQCQPFTSTQLDETTGLIDGFKVTLPEDHKNLRYTASQWFDVMDIIFTEEYQITYQGKTVTDRQTPFYCPEHQALIIPGTAGKYCYDNALNTMSGFSSNDE